MCCSGYDGSEAGCVAVAVLVVLVLVELPNSSEQVLGNCLSACTMRFPHMSIMAACNARAIIPLPRTEERAGSGTGQTAVWPQGTWPASIWLCMHCLRRTLSGCQRWQHAKTGQVCQDVIHGSELWVQGPGRLCGHRECGSPVSLPAPCTMCPIWLVMMRLEM